MIEIALFEPDIAQNAGTIARLACCFGLRLRIIEPAGFVIGSSQWRRAGMDYLKGADIVQDASWDAFREATANRRIVLITGKSRNSLWNFEFSQNDIILMGRESAGVPACVHEAASARLRIPISAQARSLNVAVACGIATGEAMRQLCTASPMENALL